jgi:PST family polysaccharide transporter
MEAAPIFRYLAPTILIYGMINPMWWLLISLGLAARSLKIALVLAPLVMTSYVVGLPYGPIGVAISYSTVMALWLLPHLAWCIRGTPVTLGDIGRAIAPPLVSAAAAAGCSWVVVAGLEPSQPIVRLILGGAMLVLAYLGVLLFVMGQRRFYVDLLKGLAKKRPQDGALA